MSKAIVASEYGGPEKLVYTEVADTAPGPGQVRVKIAAVGVNFIDIYRRQGVYDVPLPNVPGEEFAGEVVACGEGVNWLSPGDRVATAKGAGAYAEFANVDALQVVRIPDDVTYEQAAGAMLQGLTAHYLCNSVFPVMPEHTVLIHAGAGGVGLLLTQMCKLKGATIITTVSTPEKEILSKGAGADVVLGYEKFSDHVREITGGVGADVVFDGVGKATFEGSLLSLRRRGWMVLFGAASGLVPPFELHRLNGLGSLVVTRPGLWDFTVTSEELNWRASELFGLIGSGKLDVRIGGIFPLSGAGDAQEALAGRGTTGKLLLIP